MKRLKRFLFAASCISTFTFIGCVGDPEPGPGFQEPFYISFILNGQDITVQEDDPVLHYSLQPGSGNNFTNVFETGGPFDVELTLLFGFDPDKNDFLDLEGQNIPMNDDQGVPYARLFLINNGVGIDYATGLDPIDYGPSTFVVDEVIKGPKIDYNVPISGKEKTGCSYILRGHFEFQISKSSWSLGEPVDLFPVTEGIFSVRVFVP